MNAIGRHLAVVGFMGAGKSTVGREVAVRLGRPFVDADEEIERRTGKTIGELFEGGEESFRRAEEEVVQSVLEPSGPAVIALGGGAVLSERTRAALGVRAFSVLLEVEPGEAWERVQGSDRPLAYAEGRFRQLYDERAPTYRETADATAHDADDVVLAAGGIQVGLGSLELVGELMPGEGPAALVADSHVAGIHGAVAQLALGGRLASTHEVSGKGLADLEALWCSLRLDRSGTLVALGGGTTTDLAGFAAATYMRGIGWVAVPTSLVGQVDAAIGGKTAIDLPGVKNLVGAFHWPVRTLIDPALLETLPEEERRNGLAEVVKTGLLAGEALWELPEPELVRRCAAYKAALCLRDPHDRGARRALNLGHTFAHALEAASGYELPHGRAVALGLRAALRLSGHDTAPVDDVLSPEPVRVDHARAWEALLRDKKGRLRVVLLGADGAQEAELPEDEVRAALDGLIAE